MPDPPIGNPQPVSAADVRARRDHPWLVELPESQLLVQIRRVTLLELAAHGRIPDELQVAALSSLADDLDEAKEQAAPEARRTMTRRIDLINAVCAAMLVAPRMSWPPPGDPDAIDPDDLPMADRIHLYGIAVGTVEGPNMAPFPGTPGPGMAPIAHGGEVRHATVDADRAT